MGWAVRAPFLLFPLPPELHHFTALLPLCFLCRLAQSSGARTAEGLVLPWQDAPVAACENPQQQQAAFSHMHPGLGLQSPSGYFCSAICKSRDCQSPELCLSWLHAHSKQRPCWTQPRGCSAQQRQVGSSAASHSLSLPDQLSDSLLVECLLG